MAKTIDITGMQFGELTVVGFAGMSSSTRKKPMWDCVCSCGNKVTVLGESLRSNHTRSCGCKAGNLRHGHCVGRYNGGKDSPTRMTWQAMMQRCTNPKHAAFARYGAKGVNICESWKTFSGFLKDMGARPVGTTLDRIDSSKGYEPGNCRWATPKEQYQNTNLARDGLGRFSKTLPEKE